MVYTSDMDKPYTTKTNEERLAYAREYRERNREKIRQSSRELYQKKKALGLIGNTPRKANRAAIYREMKGDGCVTCGGAFPPEVLDYDHYTGVKKFAISQPPKGTTVREFMEEINKCIVVCSNCHRIRTAGRRQPGKPHRVPAVEKRRQMVIEIKSTTPCVDCGGIFNPHAMEFDHVRGEKSFIISQGHYKNTEVLMREIAKCDLVCSNCHRIRTANRMRK